MCKATSPMEPVTPQSQRLPRKYPVRYTQHVDQTFLDILDCYRNHETRSAFLRRIVTEFHTAAITPASDKIEDLELQLYGA